jgi:hypothetical protein
MKIQYDTLTVSIMVFFILLMMLGLFVMMVYNIKNRQ